MLKVISTKAHRVHGGLFYFTKCAVISYEAKIHR
jgi:hypothetical protein